MTTTSTEPPAPRALRRHAPTTWTSEVRIIAGRSGRGIRRDGAAVAPSLVVPLFSFALFFGVLGPSFSGDHLEYRAFLLATAVGFSMTGLSRAAAVVTDIVDGYLDRLLTTPVRRSAIMGGTLVADAALAAIILAPILLVGVAVGVRPWGGPLGLVVVLIVGTLWALAFSGLPYALAFKSGSPSVVASSFFLFLPVSLLTTALAPKSEMTTWMRAIVSINPLTYVLDGVRPVLYGEWQPRRLLEALAAIVAMAVIGMTLWWRALSTRTTPR